MNEQYETYEGGCGCRDIRYQMTSRPMFVHCCHCSWCQRESGSAFVINALIEADRVNVLHGRPEIIDTPSASGDGQKIARCPKCKIAVWSNYSQAGEVTKFVRVGALDDPNQTPPDIHIFTSTKQAWIQLPSETPVVAEFYSARKYWPEESLSRAQANASP